VNDYIWNNQMFKAGVQSAFSTWGHIQILWKNYWWNRT